MRSLNSSLPRSYSQNRRRQPNGELLQAFKAAALSVTQLYKTAAAEEDTARDAHIAGYQDALDDLFTYLDEQNIGLGDGEGWQVRTWATQRHQSLNNSAPTGEGEMVPLEDEDKRTRSISPTMQHKSTPQYQSVSVQTESTTADPNDGQPRHDLDRNDIFHFRSPLAFPASHDLDLDSNTVQQSSPSLRLEVVPRTSRAPSHRPGHHSRNADRVPSISLGSLGHSVGSKRKLPLHEFFDVSGLGGNKDGHSPGKRARLT